MNGVLMHALVAWRSASRSNGFRLIAVIGVLLIGAAYLAGAFSLRQPLILTLDVGLSGIRIMALMLALFWVQEIFSKDVDRHTVLFVLAYPLPRYSYVVGRYLGVMAFAALTLVIFGGLLWATASLADWNYEQSSAPVFGGAYILTLAGIWLDIAVVIAFSTWISSIAVTPFLPMLTGFAFALCARSLGAALAYLLNSDVASPEMVNGVLPLLGLVQKLIPDLGRLDWRAATLYDLWPSAADVGWAVLMALGYSGLMLVMATRAFSRREFQ